MKNINLNIEIKPKKIKAVFNKAIWWAAENSFYFSLVLIFLAILCGGLIFYKYAVLAQRAEVKISTKPFQFDEKAYKEIITRWQEREQEFNAADTKNYIDAFNSKALSPSPSPAPPE